VGIRLAVGAQPSALVRLLMREGVILVTAGIAIGLLLGFASARVLSTLLYGVGSADPLTFVGAPVVLMLAGALAAFLPARRASRVDPASVLRAE
jgi:ABC-type antimicrobial peptide transport system permease subunit